MNTDNRELVKIETDESEAMLLRAEGKLALVPKRFNDEAAAVLDRGVVASPAFAAWAHKKVRAASKTKKRRRKQSDASRRRNRS